MKILRKSKDYYDYISSGDMVDKTVVYDRRNETIVPTNLGSFGSLKTGYKIRNTHRSLDQAVYVVLEIGRTRYLFTVYAEIDTKGFATILDVQLTDIVKIEKSSGPIIQLDADADMKIYKYLRMFNISKKSEAYKEALRRSLESFKFTDTCYFTHYASEPILKDTWIPRYVSADEVWGNIYEYLSSLKDIVPEDNRTDVQIAEAHGFDKKTSFRNIK